SSSRLMWAGSAAGWATKSSPGSSQRTLAESSRANRRSSWWVPTRSGAASRAIAPRQGPGAAGIMPVSAVLPRSSPLRIRGAREVVVHLRRIASGIDFERVAGRVEVLAGHPGAVFIDLGHHTGTLREGDAARDDPSDPATLDLDERDGGAHRLDQSRKVQ